MPEEIPEGWMPTGFDGTEALIAHWKKRQADHYAIAGQRFAEVILPPYIEIFGSARKLFDKAEGEAAVVVAQTACEVLGADVLSRLVKKRGIEYLGKWIGRAVRESSDFNNQLVRDLYAALSGDRIQEQPFWGRYVGHVRARHDIVHEGRRLTKQEAQDSLNAAEEFIRHLEHVIATEGL